MKQTQSIITVERKCWFTRLFAKWGFMDSCIYVGNISYGENIFVKVQEINQLGYQEGRVHPGHTSKFYISNKNPSNVTIYDAHTRWVIYDGPIHVLDVLQVCKK